MNELDIQQSNGEGLRELALFAGAGGGILGGHLLGWRTVCAVERDAYAAQVLAQRQNDGCLRPFPIWSDVCNFDGKPWRGIVDVVSGGFPCQDISAAGKGAGIDGERSGLWREMARIIGEVRPRFVFVENSPLLVGRGLAVVISDLAEMGYDAQWSCLSASDIGAPHKRDRIWLVASDTKREPLRNEAVKNLEPKEPERSQPRLHGCDRNVADATQLQRNGCNNHAGISLAGKQVSKSGDSCGAQDVAESGSQHEQGEQPCKPYQSQRRGSEQRPIRSCCDGFRGWPTEPDVGRVADGVAARVDRLKAIGNGQVPRVAATAFDLLAGDYQ